MYTPKKNVPKAGAPAKRTHASKANAAQAKAQTGKGKSLPQNLKSGLENLSGMAMDDVQVHSNSAVPAQLQAEAFAQGHNIHLAPGKEKHLPHEAWHVVQQKQGKVTADAQTAGGIPVNTDRGLEQEADAMGHKAQNHTSIPRAPVKKAVAKQGIVQGYFLLDAKGIFMLSQQKRTTQTGKSFLKEGSKEANINVGFEGMMRVSHDLQMAVEDGNGSSDRQAKMFYGSSTVQNQANQRLAQVGSPIRLAANTGISIDLEGNRLHLLYPIDLKAKSLGHRVETPQRCNEAGPYLGNTPDNTLLTPTYNPGNPYNLPNKLMMQNMMVRLMGILPLILKQKKFERNTRIWNFFARKMKGFEDFNEGSNTMRDGGTNELWAYVARQGDNEDDGLRNMLARYMKEFLTDPEAPTILREIGLNEFIDPEVGDVLSIRSLSSAPRFEEDSDDFYAYDHGRDEEIKNPFEYHYATVIAKSGSDYVTMENYARKGEEGDNDHPLRDDDPRYYFKMFGPLEQSFHSEQKNDYSNAMTLRFSPDRQPKDYGIDIDSESVKGQIKNYNKELNFYNSQR